MKVSNILVIVDPTAGVHPAIEKAVRIASRCDARLELFACETKESRHARYAAHLAGNDPGGFVVNLRAPLELLAEPIRRQGIDVCLETETGDPLYRVLLDRIARGSADLVVKDTHHHPVVKRTFITNTDWHLIRGCPVPLLLTKARAWPSTPVVAAAVDPGHVNDRALALEERILDSANWLASRLGTRLVVCNALLPMTFADGSSLGLAVSAGMLSIQANIEARTLRLAELERLVSPYGVSMSDLHVRVGAPSEVLPALAEDQKIDILAMGAVSRSGVQRLFIGSTAEQVLESLPCDALIIKAPDFAAALPF